MRYFHSTCATYHIDAGFFGLSLKRIELAKLANLVGAVLVLRRDQVTLVVEFLAGKEVDLDRGGLTPSEAEAVKSFRVWLTSDHHNDLGTYNLADDWDRVQKMKNDTFVLHNLNDGHSVAFIRI